MDLKESDILGDSIAEHWYYRSKAKAVTKMLGTLSPTTILDVGAGSGFFSKHLLAQTSAQASWCVDTSYQSESDHIVDNDKAKTIHYRQSINAIDADLVLLMDVLEHVDDDVGLLQEYIAKVPEGACFLISVPAFQFLWSHHDVFLEHKRRYTLKQLEDTIDKSGLQLIKGSYYFGLVFPIPAITRTVQKVLPQRQKPQSELKQHSSIVNKLLESTCQLELPLMQHNRLLGLSAFCLAKKL